MKKKMIFVLEDEKNIQHLIKYNLESSGYEVICFSTGFEFLKFLKENTCDLILLDIMLPDTDGFDILSKLKRNGKNSQIPVIMLTAKKEELDKINEIRESLENIDGKYFIYNETYKTTRYVERQHHLKELWKFMHNHGITYSLSGHSHKPFAYFSHNGTISFVKALHPVPGDRIFLGHEMTMILLPPLTGGNGRTSFSVIDTETGMLNLIHEKVTPG